MPAKLTIAVLVLSLLSVSPAKSDETDCADCHTPLKVAVVDRFTPGELPLYVSLKGEGAWDIRRPCDLGGCALESAPVVGTVNDWTGFVLPGFGS